MRSLLTIAFRAPSNSVGGCSSQMASTSSLRLTIRAGWLARHTSCCGASRLGERSANRNRE